MCSLWMRSMLLLAGALSAGIVRHAIAEEKAEPILQIEAGGHTASCKWLGFTPDGRQMVSAGDDKVVRVWDLSQVIEAFPQSGATAKQGALAKVPLVRTLRFQIGSGPEGKLYAGAISPKPLPGGDWLLAVGGYTKNDEIRLIDLSSGQVLGLLQGHSNTVHSLAFSSDGRTLASGGGDRTVRVWDLSGGPGGWNRAADGTLKVKCEILTGHEAVIHGLTFVGGQEGDATLASGGEDKSLRLWWRDAKGKWSEAAVRREHTGDVMQVVASSDGRYLASASNDHTVRLWDGHDGRFIRVLGEIGGTERFTAKIAFTPDGQALVAAARSALGGCHVWRVSDGKELAAFREHGNTVFSAAVTRVGGLPAGKGQAARGGGTLVATTGGSNNDIFMWDAATGRTLGHIAGTGRPVWSVVFSPDARWIGWGNTGEDDKTLLDGKGKLEQVFDLSDMQPGRIAVTDASWQRAYLTQAGWAAEMAEDPHKLIVRRAGRETARVERNLSYDRIRCYSFVPGGGLVVGSAFKLTLHDSATGKVRHTFTGHTGEVWAVAVSPDGRLLVSGSHDQTFRVWNLATGELLLSVFAGYEADGRVSEWVAWTPAGYYKASPGGDKMIGWHLNRGLEKAADFVAAWQMRKLFEKPGIVELIPATLSVKGAIEQYAKAPGHRREEPLDIKEDLDHLHPPSIAISEPVNFQQVKGEQVHLHAKVWSTGRKPIKEVRLLVNGRPPKDFAYRAPAETEAAGPQDIHFDVPLEPGMNAIEVLAATDSATSTPQRVDVLRGTSSIAARPNCYVLGIGVKDYKNPALSLTYPADDVRDLASGFERQQGGWFQKVEKKLFLNDEANQVSIKRGLDWLRRSVTQADLAVVLISAHGWADERGVFYLAPHEFDPAEPTVTGLSRSELEERLRDLPCKVLMLIDACHSGGMVARKDGSKALTTAMGRLLKEFTSVGSGLVVMASSTESEVSMEKPEWGHGAFALAAIEALTGESKLGKTITKVSADANNDGVLYLNEFSTYVANRVKDLSGGTQHPKILPSDYSERFSDLPLAVVGPLAVRQPDLTDAQPKSVLSAVVRLPLAGLSSKLRERLSDPTFFKEFLDQRYKPAKSERTRPDALVYRVDGLRGVVTREPSQWEQLFVNFTSISDKDQVAISCMGWGKHVKAAGSNPPPDGVFTNSLWPDYEAQLSEEMNKLMAALQESLEGDK